MSEYDNTQERGEEWRFVVGSGYNEYYYTLTVPKDKDPREYFLIRMANIPISA